MFLGIGIGLTSLVVVVVCLLFGLVLFVGCWMFVDLVRLLPGFCCFAVVVLAY